VLLYVNRIHLERQLDEILPLYKQWGVAGLKYGFVQVGSQKWTAWLHDAIRKAAEYQLMVDVHDEYRPTGNTRTWPNLMTAEGVRGNETMPPAENNLVLPFTRYLCGPADYTICWYDKRLKPSGAHQLALAVVYFSPWQFVFWYDRPSIVGDEPELAFFKHVPTVWDDTRVLDGKIGQHVTITRRSGKQWFVGTIGATTRRQLKVPLTFLDADTKYTAEVYGDADPTGVERKVKIERTTVDRHTVLNADVAAGGGQAIRLVPIVQ
jgi:alpha-glucosidase